MALGIPVKVILLSSLLLVVYSSLASSFYQEIPEESLWTTVHLYLAVFLVAPVATLLISLPRIYCFKPDTSSLVSLIVLFGWGAITLPLTFTQIRTEGNVIIFPIGSLAFSFAVLDFSVPLLFIGKMCSRREDRQNPRMGI